MASCTPTEPGHAAQSPSAGQSGALCAVLAHVPRQVCDVHLGALGEMGFVATQIDSSSALRDHLYDRETAVALVYFGRDVPTGIATCRSIRRHPSGGSLPIIALLDEAAAPDYPSDCPADDVLLLPCTAAEVALRVRALIWRRNAPGADAVIRLGDISIDPVGMHVRELSVPVDLTYKEYALLCLFSQNPGVAFSRDAILAAVWGEDYMGGERTVDIHVRRLRAKLPTVEARLETIHGIGYRLSLPAGGADQ